MVSRSQKTLCNPQHSGWCFHLAAKWPEVKVNFSTLFYLKNLLLTLNCVVFLCNYNLDRITALGNVNCKNNFLKLRKKVQQLSWTAICQNAFFAILSPIFMRGHNFCPFFKVLSWFTTTFQVFRGNFFRYFWPNLFYCPIFARVFASFLQATKSWDKDHNVISGLL